MKHTGKITRIQRGRDGITLILDTDMGLRGVEVAPDLWAEILADTEVENETALIGCLVEYNPATGDLEIMGPETGPESEG